MKWIKKFTVLVLLIWANNAYAFDPCMDSINHKPRADVEYNPKGDSLKTTYGDTIKIPITINLAERFGLDVPSGAEFDTNFGFIEIDADGHVFYNNEDISGSIKDKCDNDSVTKTTKQQSKETKDGDNTDTE